MEEELSSVSCRLAHPDHIRGVSFSRGAGEIPMRAQHGTLAGAGPPTIMLCCVRGDAFLQVVGLHSLYSLKARGREKELPRELQVN
jgi:hypothetical protein